MEWYLCSTKLGESPLIAGVLTDTDVLTLEFQALVPVDLIELRVDMFNDIGPEHVVSIYKKAREKFKKPIIATIRDVSEGGWKEVPDRIELYGHLAPHSDILDAEICQTETLTALRPICDKNMKLLIGSYHNFDAMPDSEFLESVYSKGKKLEADIIKIAVTGRTRDDLLRLFSFTMKHRDEGIITMSMGDQGMSTRVFSPLCGSLITYGYVTHPSAPGQLSASELLYIFRRLKIRS